MIYSEQDINFLDLDDTQFEELCYELLAKLDYQHLVWRLGGADSGRDIEGQLAVNNPLVGSHHERWFFECKRYEVGVPAEQLNSKIAWADAEKPKHLVFLISSYLSNNTRAWLEKLSVAKPYSIHVVEGKQLKNFLLNHPEIMAKYFQNPFAKLLMDAQNNWLEHGILPNKEMLSVLIANLDPTKLTISELGFLCGSVLRDEDLVRFRSFLYQLVQLANSSGSLWTEEYTNGLVDFQATWTMSHGKAVARRITTSKPAITMYCLIAIDTDKGVEILIDATKNSPAKIRTIANDIENELNKIGEFLLNHFGANK